MASEEAHVEPNGEAKELVNAYATGIGSPRKDLWWPAPLSNTTRHSFSEAFGLFRRRLHWLYFIVDSLISKHVAVMEDSVELYGILIAPATTEPAMQDARSFYFLDHSGQQEFPAPHIRQHSTVNDHFIFALL